MNTKIQQNLLKVLKQQKNTFKLYKPVCAYNFARQIQKTNEKQEVDRLSMTPHQYYITQGRAMETPFTGKTWYEKDVGYYHCNGCNQKLFSFDQKFQNNSGMAQFWNFIKGAVEVKEIDPETDINCHENLVNITEVQKQQRQEQQELKRCECSNCGSHLGLVHFDGPPPTFTRYSINSASASFVLKEHWQDPNIQIKEDKEKKFIERQERKKAELEEEY